MNDTYLESLESPLSVDASHDDAYFTHEWLKAIWRKETKKDIWRAVSEFRRKIHISRKLSFCPFIWHLNQEKWARNDKVLFV